MAHRTMAMFVVNSPCAGVNVVSVVKTATEYRPYSFLAVLYTPHCIACLTCGVQALDKTLAAALCYSLMFLRQVPPEVVVVRRKPAPTAAKYN
jgi:hypothetical protein